MITLYHGSSLSVPAPLTGVGRRELDFGPGFYVTNLREQAERWARRVCVIRAVETPQISIYKFDETLLPADVRRLRLELSGIGRGANERAAAEARSLGKAMTSLRAALPTTKSLTP